MQIASGPTNDTVLYQKPLAVSDTGTTWGAEGMPGWSYRLRVDGQDRLLREVIDAGSVVQGAALVLALHVRPNGSQAKGFSASQTGNLLRPVIAGRMQAGEFAVAGVVETEVRPRNDDAGS